MPNERWVVRYMNGVSRWMYVTPNNGSPSSNPAAAWSTSLKSQAEAEMRRFAKAHEFHLTQQPIFVHRIEGETES